MNISMQLALLALAACLCLVDGAPENRLARTKQQRPTRGFKNVEMMTARGFGKRDRPNRAEHERTLRERRSPPFKSTSIGVARGYEKRTPEEDQEKIRRRFNPKSSLLVASDFGKRSDDDSQADEIRQVRRTFKPKSVLIARGYGKRNFDDDNDDQVYGLDNFWDMLESSPERDGQEQADDKPLESISLDWFVTEMLNNPEFTRSVVRKFIDLNQDGMLSSEELLRNV